MYLLPKNLSEFSANGRSEHQWDTDTTKNVCGPDYPIDMSVGIVWDQQLKYFEDGPYYNYI